MDFDERYRAVASRDVRFDGRFILAVRSTGIYCRPSCPARTPKPSNCAFFPTSAAAHLAGYRACKRCVPDAVPGDPDWNLRQDIAARAMRLIADGFVERGGVNALAARLGYSTRQLGRILNTELGAGPLALARAHRAQTARSLLVGTSLPVADVAFAAGFGSVRQFNETVAEVFGLSPVALRMRAGAADTASQREPAARAGAASLRLRLSARAPIDWSGLFAWFAQRAVRGVEESSTDDDGALRYARAIRLPGGAAWVELSAEAGALVALVRIEPLSELPTLLTRLRRMFDLDADPVAVDAVLGADSRLAASVARVPGIRLPGTVDAEELMVRAIVGQQITVAAATTQLARFADALGTPLPVGVDPAAAHRLFPGLAEIAEHAELFRGPQRRRDTIRAAAEAVATGELQLGVDASREQLERELTAIAGIGPWTADYLAMRLLGHPDVLVRGDVAMRAGATALGFAADPRAFEAETAGLAPWRSYLAMHCWRATPPRARRLAAVAAARAQEPEQL